MSTNGGDLLGIEIHRISGGMMRLRLVYPGGSITHTLPHKLVGEFTDEVGRFPAFFRDGKGKSVRVGKWIGPE